MARLFAISQEEEVIEDVSTNAEGQVAQAGPEDNKEDLKDVVAEPECRDKDKEEIIEIKEAVEEAVEVQDEVQEVIENNDEALETNPEGVTEEQVAEAQECLTASLARLGMDKAQRANFKVSFESYTTPAQKLSAVNKQLKACNKHIRHTVNAATAKAFDLALGKKKTRLDVSQEYTAVDWNLYLTLGGASIYRALTNKSMTRVTCPGIMISLMLSAWSDAAAIVGEAVKAGAIAAIFGDRASRVATVAEDTATVVNAIKDRSSHAHDFNNNYLKDIPNMYKLLFQNYKKVQDEKASEYKLDIADTKDVIEGIKKVCCRQLRNSRKMTAAEIHDIKLFKPEKIAKEMDTAVAYHKEHNPNVYPLAASFAKWWSTNVVGYLSSNLIVA